MQLARQGRGFFLQSGDMKMKEYFAFQDRINKEFAINPNDELFWHWLAACQEWEWGQEQLLSAMMQVANNDPAFIKRIDDLATAPDATEMCIRDRLCGVRGASVRESITEITDVTGAAAMVAGDASVNIAVALGGGYAFH